MFQKAWQSVLGDRTNWGEDKGMDMRDVRGQEEVSEARRAGFDGKRTVTANNEKLGSDAGYVFVEGAAYNSLDSAPSPERKKKEWKHAQSVYCFQHNGRFAATRKQKLMLTSFSSQMLW